MFSIRFYWIPIAQELGETTRNSWENRDQGWDWNLRSAEYETGFV